MDTTSQARARRSVRRVAVAALAVGVSSVVAVFAVAEPAHARCAQVSDGSGFLRPVPIVMSLPEDGPGVWARERPASGTCNNNDHYTGTLEDTSHDGSLTCLSISDDPNGPLYRSFCIGDGRSQPFEEHDNDGDLFFVLSARGEEARRFFGGI